jgi:hypothetical protein
MLVLVRRCIGACCSTGSRTLCPQSDSLDACCATGMRTQASHSHSRVASYTRLADSTTVHFFVAYATRPGSSAWEGGPARNSLFTGALLPLITCHASQLGVQQLMRLVRDSVFDTSRRSQVVEVRDQLVGEDVFLLPSIIGDGSGPATKRARRGDAADAP